MTVHTMEMLSTIETLCKFDVDGILVCKHSNNYILRLTFSFHTMKFLNTDFWFWNLLPRCQLLNEYEQNNIKLRQIYYSKALAEI